MNTEIRSLQLLDDDLQAVAARERDRLASIDRALDADPGGPRRLPRRGRGGGNRNWGGMAAALVVVLVLAGGIGVLSQGAGDDATPASGDAAGSGAQFQERGDAVSYGGSSASPAVGRVRPVPSQELQAITRECSEEFAR